MKYRLNKSSVTIIGLNILFVILYLFVASYSWKSNVEREAGVVSADAGSAIVWAESAVPIAFAAIALNLLYVAILTKAGRLNDIKRSAVLMGAFMWISAIVFDLANH
jgi:putative effector of murein hydrolase LrgA (UPF0299 family)